MDGQFIPATAFESPRLAEKSVFCTEMEHENLELSIFTEIRERGNGERMTSEATACQACAAHRL